MAKKYIKKKIIIKNVLLKWYAWLIDCDSDWMWLMSYVLVLEYYHGL